VVSTAASSGGVMAGAATDSTGPPGSGGGDSSAVAGVSSGSSMRACVDELADNDSDIEGDITTKKDNNDEVRSVYSIRYSTLNTVSHSTYV
jgi:hypothetical protein